MKTRMPEDLVYEGPGHSRSPGARLQLPCPSLGHSRHRASPLPGLPPCLPRTGQSVSGSRVGKWLGQSRRWEDMKGWFYRLCGNPE